MSPMKYIFLAIAFFALGYVIPTFAPLVQLAVVLVVASVTALVLYFYVETMSRMHLVD